MWNQSFKDLFIISGGTLFSERKRKSIKRKPYSGRSYKSFNSLLKQDHKNNKQVTAETFLPI
jgi:hypothetical protein